MVYYSLNIKLKVTNKHKIIIFSKSIDMIIAAGVICQNIGCECFINFHEERIKKFSEITNMKIRDIIELTDYNSEDIVILIYFDDENFQNFLNYEVKECSIINIGKESLMLKTTKGIKTISLILKIL